MNDITKKTNHKVQILSWLIICIGLQALLLIYIINELRFAFTYDHFGTGIDPLNTLSRSLIALTVPALFPLFKYELLFLFRKDELYSFAEKHPLTKQTFFYRSSALVTAAYILGALFCMVNGVGFFFSSCYGIGAFVLYNICLAICVVPVILVPVCIIYYLSHRGAFPGEKHMIRDLCKMLLPGRTGRTVLLVLMALSFGTTGSSAINAFLILLTAVILMVILFKRYMKHREAEESEDARLLKIRIMQDKANKT